VWSILHQLAPKHRIREEVESLTKDKMTNNLPEQLKGNSNSTLSLSSGRMEMIRGSRKQVAI
jgi:hypothetical protein